MHINANREKNVFREAIKEDMVLRVRRYWCFLSLYCIRTCKKSFSKSLWKCKEGQEVKDHFDNPESLVNSDFPKRHWFWAIIKSDVVSFDWDLVLQSHNIFVLLFCLILPVSIILLGSYLSNTKVKGREKSHSL